MLQQNEKQAEVQAAVNEALEKNENFMPQTLAQELSVPLESVISALPAEMRVSAPASDFLEIWEEISTWEKITFMASTAGIILEISCQLPKGKSGHGMYNLMGKGLPFGGHVMPDKIASVWFVSKPLFGLESHSVQFFDHEGNQAFAMYLGRGDDRQIIPSVREKFMALKNKYNQ